MPADLRARDQWQRPGVRVIGYVDSRAARARRVVCRLLAAFTWVFSFVFAYAALLLARSSDPFTVIVPVGIACFLGWCAHEIWPRARVFRSSGGGSVVAREVRTTTEGSAHRIDVK